MPSNIEIKARVSDLSGLRRKVRELAREPYKTFFQEDIFFTTRTGRLKLRILSENSGELIYYERSDSNEPRLSRYEIYKTSRPLELRQLLTSALGETITVRKNREVYLVEQTRIHIDEVENLGTFVELEVVLRHGQHPEEGRFIAKQLMNELGIDESHLIPHAYADLLLAKLKKRT